MTRYNKTTAESKLRETGLIRLRRWALLCIEYIHGRSMLVHESKALLIGQRFEQVTAGSNVGHGPPSIEASRGSVDPITSGFDISEDHVIWLDPEAALNDLLMGAIALLRESTVAQGFAAIQLGLSGRHSQTVTAVVDPPRKGIRLVKTTGLREARLFALSVENTTRIGRSKMRFVDCVSAFPSELDNAVARILAMRGQAEDVSTISSVLRQHRWPGDYTTIATSAAVRHMLHPRVS